MTRRQKDLYDFLRAQIAETGIAPSFEEMKDALGLTSKAGIHRALTALEEQGWITRVPYRARRIEIVDRPPPAAIPAKPDVRHSTLVRYSTAALIAELNSRGVPAVNTIPSF